MPSVLKKLLETQLGPHVRIQMDSGESRPIRVTRATHSRKAAKKSRSSPSNSLYIVSELKVYTSSCGAISRSGIHGCNPAGMVVLLESGSGQDFLVELNGSPRKRGVTRVSSGATARDLRKAIFRARNVSRNTKSRSDLRVFRVNAMHFSAAWLHHRKKNGADIFVPYTPNFAGFRPGRIYRLPRFESLIKKCALGMILRWYWRYEKALGKRKASSSLDS